MDSKGENMATRSLNKVQLIGNLTRDTELRYTSSGTAIATFTVATNRNYTNSSGENIEDAEFTNVVAWAKLAEICAQFLKKGSKVFIEGRLSTNKWTDQESGREMRRTEVVASDMIVLSGGTSSDDNSRGNNGNSDDNSNDMDQDVNFDELQGFEEADKSGSDKSDDSDDGKTPF
jgi:single-strand DNA-binding protein